MGSVKEKERDSYSKPSRKAIKSWRISMAIFFGILLLIGIPVLLLLLTKSGDTGWRCLILAGMAALIALSVIGIVCFPKIEYKQWGYLLADDKVIIRHGMFWVKKVVIPVIRIQNITISQGPIHRTQGLYNVTIALASGSFIIEGLEQETADAISENLKSRLYRRAAEKGVL